MIYSKDDIILESGICADITQISVACDMMIESFVDSADEEYTLEEAGNKALQSIKASLMAIIEKIKKFIQEAARNVRDKINQKKIKMALDTLRKAEVIKSKGPDVLKAHELLKKYEDMVDKYLSELDNVLDNVEDSEKLNKLIKFATEVDKNLTDLATEIYDVLTSENKQIVYDKSQYEAILKYGLTINVNYEQFGTTIINGVTKLNERIIDLFSKMDGVKVVMVEASDKKSIDLAAKKEKVRQSAANIKSSLMAQLNNVQSFMARHKKAVIAITSAVVVAAGAVIAYRNTPNSQIKRKGYYFDKKNNQVVM